jgi:hypothetical protein
VLAAVVLLLEMVQGFPFVTASDRANYLGALLTPCIRPMLPPPYPLFGIGAPMQGSGKSYLALLLRTIHGGVLRAEWPREEAEVKKSILALLRDTTGPVIQHDNVTGTLRSPSLSALLAADTFSDRLLGVNENPVHRNDRLWVITGNSLSYGGDIPRRTIEVTIDPNMPRPWDRTDFAIKDLPGWVKARRGELLRALLVLARSWVVAGKPVEPWTQSDSFGRYLQAIRGVLTSAGIVGTFADPVTKSEPEGSDDQEWAEFLVALRRHFETRSFTVGEIVSALLASEYARRLDPDCLPQELAEKWAKAAYGPTSGFAKSLGKWLLNRRGRWAGSLNVRRLDFFDRSGVALWRIEGNPGGLGE